MRTEQASPADARARDDRRVEPREAASGEVHLCQSVTPGTPFLGHLLDIAASGFRARHEQFSLTSGELIDFEFAGNRGVARVVWTRIVENQVETGFRVCHRQPW